jgi:hypothetical protein
MELFDYIQRQLRRHGAKIGDLLGKPLDVATATRKIAALRTPLRA